MRCFWQVACAVGLVAVAASADSGQGQVPGAAVPGAAAAPAAAAPVAAAPAAAGAAKEGFFKRMCTALDECRRKICKTPLGQLLNSMTMPATAMTGGVIPPFCPMMPSAKDLAQPGAAGAAAAAKKEALEAKQRREAVRYLSTLDCRYFPDAAPQLALALRTDSSECVRFEAALGLNNGCCCTAVTLKALEASVSGTDSDGAPAERSVRVRCAAASALEKCLSCYTAPVEPVEPGVEGGGGEKPPMGEKGPGNSANTKPAQPGTLPTTLPNSQSKKDAKPARDPNRRMPTKAEYEHARNTLNEFTALLAAYQPSAVTRASFPPSGRQDVFHIVRNSASLGSNPSTEAISTVLPQTRPTPMTGAAPVMTPRQVPARMPVNTRTPAAPTSAAPVTADTSVNPTAATQSPVSTASATQDDLTTLAKQTLGGPTQADRHAAIRQIVRYDWHQHPMVAAVLLAGAKADPSNVVRVDCLRHIAAYRVNHPQVMADLTALSSDPDGWVRQEAAQCLAQLKQVP